MAEESQDGQEKTEDPSQRKLEKSAEDGKVLTSKEMFVFTSMFAAFVLMFVTPLFAQKVLAYWSRLFHFTRPDDLMTLAFERFYELIFSIIIAGLFVGVPMIIIVIGTQVAVGGLNFAPKAFNFKGNRLNPLQGFKRMFGTKGLMELTKSILKVVLLFAIAAVTIYALLPSVLELPSRDLGTATIASLLNFPFLLGMLLIILAIIAMIDYFWQRHTHIQSLRMTKQEVKDEYKQTEGSPEVKAKIRRMQMETAANAGRQQAALDDVPDATAVITNPTHFAVALKYEVGSSEAPKILAMGRGNMAHQIIERANGADVTVFRSPLLARALYYTGEIGAEIAEQLYQAVAVVLAYLYRVDRGEVLAEPEVEIPESLRFTENGQPLKGENSNRANYEA
ncbi:MAG: flagellar biosynthesis protein FlhB [Candidatus Puniceispirillaceae bacterium]|tara:strand:- start:964 stop:2145 length:1182 start_codon:yes stop_codon:yes gene_type:complete